MKSILNSIAFVTAFTFFGWLFAMLVLHLFSFTAWSIREVWG